MRRVSHFLLRNWPLKVGAVLLATVLYSGLVLGQNVRTWTGVLPVDTIRPPAGATLLADLEPVTQIRFRAPLDVGVLSPDSFRATVDLSRAEARPGGPPEPVPVTVIAFDQRVQIVDYQPRVLEIRLDPVATRQMQVTVALGSVPEGLNVGPPQTEPGTVTVSGPSSRVEAVSAVVARVAIDASALNVDREVDLVPVDANGNQVPNIELDPDRARVRIAVARELANLTLPVVPQLVGEPAPGYRLESVAVEPLVVTVSGEEATVTRLESAPTDPIDVTGRTSDLEAMVGLDLPEGIGIVGSDQVKVSLIITEDVGSRSFLAGVTLGSQRAGYEYALGSTQATLTVGGTLTELAAIDAARLTVVADVASLESGTHQVPLRATLPDGLELLGVSPSEVSVTVSQRESSAAPRASGPQAIAGRWPMRSGWSP